jgi:hypothetical protein
VLCFLPSNAPTLRCAVRVSLVHGRAWCTDLHTSTSCKRRKRSIDVATLRMQCTFQASLPPLTWQADCRHYLQRSLELTAALARWRPVKAGPVAPLPVLATLESSGQRAGQEGLVAYQELLQAGWPDACAADVVLTTLLEASAAGNAGLGMPEAVAIITAAAGINIKHSWQQACNNNAGRLAAMAGWSSHEFGPKGLARFLVLLPPVAEGPEIASIACAVGPRRRSGVRRCRAWGS